MHYLLQGTSIHKLANDSFSEYQRKKRQAQKSKNDEEKEEAPTNAYYQ